MEKRKCIVMKYKLALPMVLLSGLLFAVLAWKMDTNAGPDEMMRYSVAEWIVTHNALPTGFEFELINPYWGYSYAFTPYLPTMIAALFVKAASLFSSELQVLLFAARLVNVFAGMGTVYVAFRIGDRLFANKGSVYFFAAVMAYLPQFTFLAGYLNNDMMSLLAAFMILDAVMSGDANGWSVRNMLYLAFGVSISALTYFFGYGWILFAVAGFFYTSIRRAEDKKKVMRNAGIIVLFVLAIAGWYFIRNAVIYHGDFLGYRAQSECVELYKQQELRWPVNNPGMRSMFLRDMLTRGRWTETTIESLIGMFGGMTICLDGKFYDLYQTSFWMCVLLFTLYRYKTKDKLKTPMLFMLLFVFIFPIVFSIYSSYTRDFSPQGRYIITIMPVVCVLMSMGIDECSKAVEQKYEGSKPALSRFGRLIPYLAAISLFIVFIIIYYTVMLPTLTFIVLPGADKVSFYYVR